MKGNIGYFRDLLFILYAVYFAQGSLYTQGSIISQLCLISILGISLLFFIRTIIFITKKEPFYYAWTFLLVLNITGFIFTGEYSNPIHSSMFKNILVCSLSFYPFYYFTKKKSLEAKHLVRFLFILLPLTVLEYFHREQRILMERVSDSNNVVNNVAYLFLDLVPFIFLIKNRRVLSLSIMAVILFFVIESSKRGAIICGGVALIVYFIYQINTVDKRNRAIGYLIGIITFTVLVILAYKTLVENEFLLRRLSDLSEGNSSGRDVIYSNVFNGWYNSTSLLNLLFGYGFAGSLLFTGGFLAHNDWLELLSNFGLLGVVTYLSLFITAVMNLLNKSWAFENRMALLATVSLWFLTTLFSMWYISLSGYTQAIMFAYLIGSKGIIRKDLT